MVAVSCAIRVELPDGALERIAQRVAELLRGSAEAASPWMSRKEAAEYLGVPVSRLEKDRRVPAHRDEGRVFYHRNELDEYLLRLGR
jgi:hypothetical protein